MRRASLGNTNSGNTNSGNTNSGNTNSGCTNSGNTNSGNTNSRNLKHCVFPSSMFGSLGHLGRALRLEYARYCEWGGDLEFYLSGVWPAPLSHFHFKLFIFCSIIPPPINQPMLRLGGSVLYTNSYKYCFILALFCF